MSSISEDENTDCEFQCYVCKCLNPSAAVLHYHLFKTHGIEKAGLNMCCICNEEFWTQDHLNYHLSAYHHVPDQSLLCFACGVSWQTQKELEAHKKKHRKRFKCSLCPLLFSSKYQLTLHIECHVEILQPYVCHFCGKRFRFVQTRDLHLWRHGMQSCKEDSCHVQVEDESLLDIHLREAHSDLQSYDDNLRESRDETEVYVEKFFSLVSPVTDSSVARADFQDYFTLKQLCIQLKAKAEALVSLCPKLTEESVGSLVSEMSCLLTKSKDFLHPTCLEDKKMVLVDKMLLKTHQDVVNVRRRVLKMPYSSVRKLKYNIKGYVCPQCSLSFRTRRQMKVHCVSHHSNTIKDDILLAETELVRPECGKPCLSREAYMNHRKVHTHAHSSRKHSVGIKKTAVRKQDKKHHCVKKLSCKTCGKKLSSMKNFRKHTAHHNSKKNSVCVFTCCYCQRKFLDSTSHQVHMMYEKHDYPCSACGASFATRKKQLIHSLQHSICRKDRYPCPSCEQKFAYKSQLEVHERSHKKTKLFRCELCNRTFTRLQQRQLHHKSLHEEAKESCEECGKMFHLKFNLMRHKLLVHLNLKRWICGLCGTCYAFSHDLRTHLSKHHDVIMSKVECSSRKSLKEVYVIPSLGSHLLSEDMARHIEKSRVAELRKLLTLDSTEKFVSLSGEEHSLPNKGGHSDAKPVVIVSSMRADDAVIGAKPPVANASPSILQLKPCFQCQSLVPAGLCVMCSLCHVSFCSSYHMLLHTSVFHQGSQGTLSAQPLEFTEGRMESRVNPPSIVLNQISPLKVVVVPVHPVTIPFQHPFLPQQMGVASAVTIMGALPGQVVVQPLAQQPHVVVLPDGYHHTAEHYQAVSLSQASALPSSPPQVAASHSAYVLQTEGSLEPALKKAAAVAAESLVQNDQASSTSQSSGGPHLIGTDGNYVDPSSIQMSDEEQLLSERSITVAIVGGEPTCTAVAGCNSGSVFKSTSQANVEKLLPASEDLGSVKSHEGSTSDSIHRPVAASLSGGCREEHACSLCRKTFDSVVQLERHRKVHGQKEFSCSECGKSFVEKYNLKCHQLTHTQERHYQCHECQRTFRYHRDLKEHLIFHQDIKPHQCHQCERVFLRTRDLSRHLKEQHGNTGYTCPVCQVKFKRKAYLKTVHMKLHQNMDGMTSEAENVALSCSTCSEVFSSAKNLQDHLISHREITHRCSLCTKSFLKKQLLLTHMKVHKQR